MKKLLEGLRGARKLELFLAIAAAAVLLLLWPAKYKNPGGQTDIEQRLCAILSEIEGVGKVRTMVTEGDEGEIGGVLIVAEGADDIAVQLRLRYAVQTLLEVNASEIEVAKYAR